MLKAGKIIKGKQKYKIIKYWKEGGTADLYLGTNLTTNHKVVIKVLRNSEFDNLEQAENYLRREQAFIDIQSKNSPDTLQLLDVIIQKRTEKTTRFILVTKYIKGPDLEDWIYNFIDQEPNNYYYYIVRHIFYPLSDYFAYCHNHGILHRDLSTTNILITSKKKRKAIPVVIDWGASLNFDPAKLYDIPDYMDDLEFDEEQKVYTESHYPPEIHEGKIYIPQSDIYCFGAIMYFAFTKGVYRDDSTYNIDFALEVKEANPECPDLLNYIVKRCTEYEPRDRYLSFEDMKMDLKKFLSSCRKSKKISKKKGNNEL